MKIERLFSLILTAFLIFGLLIVIPEGTFGLSYTKHQIDGSVIWFDPNTGTIVDVAEDSKSVLEIPSYIDGVMVTDIGDHAVAYCKELTRVIIPSSVKRIGDCAFVECTSLSSISLPYSVEYIGQAAFSDCCSLQEITIPCSVTTIGGRVFSGCSSLKSIEVDKENSHYASLEGVLFDKTMRTLICYPSGKIACEYNIPDTVTDTEAFDACGNLESIRIPTCMTNFRNPQNCFKLKRIDVATQNTEYASEDGVLFNKSKSTLLCYPMGREEECYNVPDGVTQIGSGAFTGCSLKTVSLPASTWGLGRYAFSNCENLHNINIPNGVSSIGQDCFEGCLALTSLSIPNTVTYIGCCAFYGCTKLSSINIPDSARIIEWDILKDTAYYNNPLNWNGGALYVGNALLAVKSNTDKDFAIKNGTKVVAAHAFSNSGITSLAIPSSVRKFHNDAVRQCDELTSISVDIDIINPENEKFAFGDCGGISGPPISEVILICGDCENAEISPKSVYSLLGGEIFYGEEYPSTIVVSDGIKKIDRNAFYGCDNVKELYLPKSLEEISSYCVENSWAPELNVYYEGSDEKWNLLTLFGDDVSAPLYKVKMHYGITRPSGSTRPGGNTDTPQARKTVAFMGAIYNKENEKIAMDINWNFNLFNGDARTFNNDLAVAALVLSANAYDCDLLEKTLETLGFENFFSKNYDEINFLRMDDHVAFTIASKVYEGQNIIVVVCRGTANHQELKQDILTNANGFGAAAIEVTGCISEYLKQHNIDTSKRTKVLVTGHSRGGAVANWLGTGLVGVADLRDTFVYTFATPNTTLLNSNYENIHNLTNVDDFVPTLPPILHKFGVEYAFKTDSIPAFNNNFFEITGVSANVLRNPFSLFDCGSESYAFPWRNHAPAVYMAALLRSANLHRGGYNIKQISIKCPVDVLVYDNHNQLLGKIENNVPSDSLFENGIYATVKGEEKYIYTTEGAELELKLIGTDSGYMNYSIQVIDSESSEVLDEKSFNNVALTNGKVMTSSVGDIAETNKVKLYSMNPQGNVLTEIKEDGTEMAVTSNPNGDSPATGGGGGAFGGGGGGGGAGASETVPEDTTVITEEVENVITGYPSDKFTDVAPNSWYRQYVDYALENGLMTGVEENKFAPEMPLTRNMLVTILWRLEGKPVAGKSSFSDVKEGAWYVDAVAWAEASKLVEGSGEGKFNPAGNITREQFATMIYRYAMMKAYDVSGSADLSVYTEDLSVSSWAMSAMQWANAESFITGRSETSLAPRGEATRAETAAILMRFIERYK